MERFWLKTFTRTLPIIALLALFFAQLACATSLQGVPTASEEEMATRVAMALTNVALSGVTGEPAQPDYTATLSLPTLGPPTTPTETASRTQSLDTETPQPSETPTLTETPTPSETPTETPLPTDTLIPPNTATPEKPSFSPGYRDPHTYLGSPTWTDLMLNGANWNQETDAFTDVSFHDSVFMRLTGLSEFYGWRLAATPPLGNAYIEMNVTTEVCSKRDTYGLILRSPELKVSDQGYLFGITCQGEYLLMEWDGKAGENGHMTTLIPFTKDGSIRAGSNKSNRVGAMLVDNRIILYVNGIALAEISDNTYPGGYFGVLIAARETAYFSVRVEDISYWLDAAPKK